MQVLGPVGKMNANEEARQLIERALSLVGEEDFASLLNECTNERVRIACSRLFSSEWWETTLQAAITNPKQYDTALLSALLNKAVATKQAQKEESEEGFKLLIEAVCPTCSQK